MVVIMKKVLSFIFSLFLIVVSFLFYLPYGFAVSEETNLLLNGDFNDVEVDMSSLAGEYKPNYWGKINLKGSIRNDNDYCATCADKNEDFFLHQGNFELQAGKYTVHFEAKIKNGTCNIAVGFRVNNEFVVCETDTLSNLSDYTEKTYELDLAESGVYEFCFKSLDISKTLYIDNMRLYYEGNGGEEQGQEEVPPENNVQAHGGAYIRTVKNSAGLRFKGEVDKQLFDGYVAEYGRENVSAGMIIAPTDFLRDCEFTYLALSQNKAVQVCVAEQWNNEDTCEEDGYYGFNCAFINILPYNIDRKFSFRSFIRFTEGENTEYVYGGYSETDNARSLYEVALAAREDAAKYEDYQVEIIEYFCNLIDYPAAEISANGNTFTLTFSDIKGYFVLDYDKTAYSLSGATVSVGGFDAKSFGGMELIAENSDITITFTVNTEESLTACPVRGKVYKIK